MSDGDENNSLAGAPSPSPSAGDLGPTHQLVETEERADDEDDEQEGNELKEDSFLNLEEEKDFTMENNNNNDDDEEDVAKPAARDEPTTAGQEAERVAAMLNSGSPGKKEDPPTKRDREEQDTSDVVNDDGANKKQKVEGGGTNVSVVAKPQQVIHAEHPTIELDMEPPPVPASNVGIMVFHDNDVLSGRGGGTNVHPGNRHFRDLIDKQRKNYLRARKNHKPTISRMIVRTIRQNNGRFLKKDDRTGLWFEIGDDQAREKTSQALRQRAPEMRKMMFDAERDEVRGVVEDQMRHQRMMMGMQPDGSVVAMPGMPPGMGMAPMGGQPGMAYGPGGTPMMFGNPPFFVAGMPGTPQSFKGAPAGVYPHPGSPMNPSMMHPAMADQYQQAMFQAAVMGGMTRFHPHSMAMPQQQPAQQQQQQQPQQTEQQQQQAEQQQTQQQTEQQQPQAEQQQTETTTTAPISVDNVEPTNMQIEHNNAESGAEEVNTGEEKLSSE